LLAVSEEFPEFLRVPFRDFWKKGPGAARSPLFAFSENFFTIFPQKSQLLFPHSSFPTLQNALAPKGYYYAPDPATHKVSASNDRFGKQRDILHWLGKGRENRN
jgi:hypothetical protein